MAKEGVIGEIERKSLEISEFIFHVIDPDQEGPLYLSEVELESQQIEFFRERILEVSKGTQFEFLDKESGLTYKACESLIENTEENFVTESKRLAHHFTSLHEGRMSPGVFIISILKVNTGEGEASLVSLIKMDYRRVLQLKVDGEKGTLQEIVQALVEDKASLQKVALVDVGDNYVWDVLGVDKKTRESVADYFRRFLGVQEREDASVLTRRAFSEVKKWASENKEKLPEGEDPSTFRNRAYEYFNTHTTFDTEEFLEMVVYDYDMDRKKELELSLQDRLESIGVAGQTFPVKPGSLKHPNQNRIKTDTGVAISWEGPAEAKNVELPKSKSNDDFYHIVIKTPEYQLE